MIIIAALIMAGLAQWYLTKFFLLGAVAQIWSACFAVVGGYLARRMENAAGPIFISTTACSLVIPFAVDLI